MLLLCAYFCPLINSIPFMVTIDTPIKFKQSKDRYIQELATWAKPTNPYLLLLSPSTNSIQRTKEMKKKTEKKNLRSRAEEQLTEGHACPSSILMQNCSHFFCKLCKPFLLLLLHSFFLGINSTKQTKKERKGTTFDSSTTAFTDQQSRK